MVVTEIEAHVPGKDTSRAQHQYGTLTSPNPFHPSKSSTLSSPLRQRTAFPPLFPLSQLPPWLPPQKHISPRLFILFQPLSHNFPMKGSSAKRAEALHFPAETLKIYLPSSQPRYTSESWKNTNTVEQILPRLWTSSLPPASSRSTCRDFVYAATKSRNLRTSSLFCQLPFFFFHDIFGAVRTPSLPPAPTGASWGGRFTRSGRGTLLPSQRGETQAAEERQSKRSQLSSACGVPAARWQGKTERKVITGAGKPGAEPNTQKPQQTGQEAICSITASFCTETAAAAASRGLPKPTPNSPQPQQNLPGLQLHS